MIIKSFNMRAHEVPMQAILRAQTLLVCIQLGEAERGVEDLAEDL